MKNILILWISLFLERDSFRNKYDTLTDKVIIVNINREKFSPMSVHLCMFIGLFHPECVRIQDVFIKPELFVRIAS